MVLVELEDLTLGYNGQAVVTDVNLKIEEGDFICVVGPNGAGKSTLVKGILGLLAPMNGKVVYRNLQRNFIGYMPQETKVDANFPASVMEVVLAGTLNGLGTRFWYGEAEREIAIKSMMWLGIGDLKDVSFSELSGGQRQKVLLARSLAATRKLLILDEPSNSLDMSSKNELYRCLEKLNREEGIAVMMITHDLDHDNLIGRKILSLGSDEIFYGTTEEFVRKVHYE